MNPLDLLFNAISGTIRNHASPDTPGPSYDANPLLGAISGIFGNHANSTGQSFGGQNVAPASQDPYGDPGDLTGRSVLPASQDPFGDPADQR